jgi:hypothetical protein
MSSSILKGYPNSMNNVEVILTFFSAVLVREEWFPVYHKCARFEAPHGSNYGEHSLLGRDASETGRSILAFQRSICLKFQGR